MGIITEAGFVAVGAQDANEKIHEVHLPVNGIRSYIGGWIQHTIINNGQFMMLYDEEGMIKRLPFNRRILGRDILGPLLIVESNPDGFKSMSPENVKMFLKMFNGDDTAPAAPPV